MRVQLTPYRYLFRQAAAPSRQLQLPSSPVVALLVEARYSLAFPGKLRPHSRNPAGQNPGVLVRALVLRPRGFGSNPSALYAHRMKAWCPEAERLSQPYDARTQGSRWSWE